MTPHARALAAFAVVILVCCVVRPEKVREVFNPFRLPIDLTIRTPDLRGVAKALVDTLAQQPRPRT
jgi:hypothetical protein